MACGDDTYIVLFGTVLCFASARGEEGNNEVCPVLSLAFFCWFVDFLVAWMIEW